MYYNSNQNSSAYYNAYKQEMATLEDYHDEFSFQKVMKIGVMILALGLLSILTIYLVNSFSTVEKEAVERQPIQNTPKEKISQAILLEESLPKSIQLEESITETNQEIQYNSSDTQKVAEVKVPNEQKAIEKTAQVSPKDVALIVEIILAQMNHKEEIPLEKQLLSAEENTINTKTLKESNHYNKVIVATSESEQTILERALLFTEGTSSSYEQAIKKELDVRSNEMRIIIVQRGDTLSKIAKKAYGDIDAYPKIFKANPELLKNPDEIFAGQRLRIPA